jgi:hypothetical protein
MSPFRTFSLALLHSRLDRAVREEARRRFPDHERLTRLKKFRLAAKDRLAGLRSGPVSA